MSPASPEAYDFVIVGAGAAGCLLANRLSSNPRHRVLLLEAGEADRSLWFRVPVGYRNTIGNPRFDWCWETEAEAGLGGRRLKLPRGKVLGGSTAINGMVAIRGHHADYDGWRDSGLPGWGWDDVLPYFKRHEKFFGGESAAHATQGEWRVDQARVHWPINDRISQAAQQAGIPYCDDFNRGDADGVGPIHVSQSQGLRWSAADAFLTPIKNRPNLCIRTQTVADRLDMRDGRAVGIHYHRAGGSHFALASAEVLLCAGAYASPALLMRSGLGPAVHLQALGIPLCRDMPGVGANLQDHLQVAVRYQIEGADTLNRHMNSRWCNLVMLAKFLTKRQGPLTMAPCQVGLFTHSRPGLQRPDLAYNVLAFSRTNMGKVFDPHPGVTMISYDLQPTSRGQVRLSSTNAHAAPLLAHNYLQTERDQQVAVDSIRTTRRIMRQDALKAYAPRENWAGNGVSDADHDGLLQVFRDNCASIFHPAGTARMGLAADARSVVDGDLRVHGVAGLRVCDASVMPTLISGNTAWPTLMIAEKAAEAIQRSVAGY